MKEFQHVGHVQNIRSATNSFHIDTNQIRHACHFASIDGRWMDGWHGKGAKVCARDRFQWKDSVMASCTTGHEENNCFLQISVLGHCQEDGKDGVRL